MTIIPHIPNPECFREKLKSIESVNFTFDDGVKLVIEGATPAIMSVFLMFQGIDLGMKSEEGVPDVINWFRCRGASSFDC